MYLLFVQNISFSESQSTQLSPKSFYANIVADQGLSLTRLFTAITASLLHNYSKMSRAPRAGALSCRDREQSTVND